MPILLKFLYPSQVLLLEQYVLLCMQPTLFGKQHLQPSVIDAQLVLLITPKGIYHIFFLFQLIGPRSFHLAGSCTYQVANTTKETDISGWIAGQREHSKNDHGLLECCAELKSNPNVLTCLHCQPSTKRKKQKCCYIPSTLTDPCILDPRQPSSLSTF